MQEAARQLQMALMQGAHGGNKADALARLAPRTKGLAQLGDPPDDRGAGAHVLVAIPKQCSGPGKRRARTSSA